LSLLAATPLNLRVFLLPHAFTKVQDKKLIKFRFGRQIYVVFLSGHCFLTNIRLNYLIFLQSFDHLCWIQLRAHSYFGMSLGPCHRVGGLKFKSQNMTLCGNLVKSHLWTAAFC